VLLARDDPFILELSEIFCRHLFLSLSFFVSLSLSLSLSSNVHLLSLCVSVDTFFLCLVVLSRL
jgi:hypothetical protein